LLLRKPGAMANPQSITTTYKNVDIGFSPLPYLLGEKIMLFYQWID